MINKTQSFFLILNLILYSFFGFECLAGTTYNMSSSQDVTIQTNASSSDRDLFYDDGGSTSNYSASISGRTVTFTCQAGMYVRIKFISVSISSDDNLSFYDGASVLSRKIGASDYTSNSSVMIVSTSGALTVCFSSNGSNESSGWSAQVWVTDDPGLLWMGTSSSSTLTSSNWEESRTPNSFTSICLKSDLNVTNSVGLICDGVYIASGKTMTVSGLLFIYGNLNCQGTISYSSGLSIYLLGGTSSCYASFQSDGNVSSAKFKVGGQGSGFYKMMSNITCNDLSLELPSSGSVYFDMNNYGLTVTSITIPSGVNFYQQQGVLTLKGSSITINSASFKNVFGTTRFASGTLASSMNQTIPAVTYYNLIIEGFGNKSLNGITTVKGELRVLSGTFFMGSHTLNLEGDFVNLASFNSSTSLLVANGGAQQSITSGGQSFYKVEINNLNGIRLVDEMGIQNSLRFINGNIISNSGSPLSLGSVATVTGFSDQSHVIGIVKKNTTSTTEFVFPLGGINRLNAISIEPISTASTTWLASYTPSSYSTVNVVPDLVKVSDFEYWTLTRNQGISDAVVKLHYNVASMTNLVSSPSDLAVALFNTSTNKWERVGNTGNINGNEVSGKVTSFVQNWFGDFTFGTPFYNVVALAESNSEIYVECNSKNREIIVNINNVILNTNNLIFETSFDGISWERIDSLALKYNSLLNEVKINIESIEGLRYLRLSNKSLDGVINILDTKYVMCDEKIESEIGIISPNPASTYIELKLTNEQISSNHEIQVFDLSGKLILNDTFEGIEHIFSIDHLKSGGYVLYLDKIQHLKFIKN